MPTARFGFNGTPGANIATVMTGSLGMFRPSAGDGFAIYPAAGPGVYSATAKVGTTSANCAAAGGSFYLADDAGNFLFDSGSVRTYDLFVRIASAPNDPVTFIGGTYFTFNGMGWTADGRIAQVVADATVSQTSAAGVVPFGAWFRMRVYQGMGGIYKVDLWRGANVDGETEDFTHIFSSPITGTYSMFGFDRPGVLVDDLIVSSTGGAGITHPADESANGGAPPVTFAYWTYESDALFQPPPQNDLPAVQTPASPIAAGLSFDGGSLGINVSQWAHTSMHPWDGGSINNMKYCGVTSNGAVHSMWAEIEGVRLNDSVAEGWLEFHYVYSLANMTSMNQDEVGLCTWGTEGLFLTKTGILRFKTPTVTDYPGQLAGGYYKVQTHWKNGGWDIIKVWTSNWSSPTPTYQVTKTPVYCGNLSIGLGAGSGIDDITYKRGPIAPSSVATSKAGWGFVR
jgi:hypothetical protein